jgi:hypothetical protein
MVTEPDPYPSLSRGDVLTDFDIDFLTWLQRQAAAFPDSDISFRIVDTCLFVVATDRQIALAVAKDCWLSKAFQELPSAIADIQVLKNTTCIRHANRARFAKG